MLRLFDEFGYAEVFSLNATYLPYPPPAVEDELCYLRLVSLTWKPGFIDGAVDADCVVALDEPVNLQTVSGHANPRQMALLTGVVAGLSAPPVTAARCGAA